MGARLLQWLREHRERLFLLAGILLVGILCFEAGWLEGKSVQEEPLVLTLPPVPTESTSGGDGATGGQPPTGEMRAEPVVAKLGGTETGCLFVGSKNSNKYHLPSCAVAKRINPENRVCFASKEEAEKRGYVPSCLK